MAYILNIDTATNSAAVHLSNNNQVIASATNNDQMDHASWINIAIQNVLKETNLAVSDLSAVAVSEGPGSYTGLRVAMATAKGLCYASNLFLICESTLKLMAASAMNNNAFSNETLFAPMIDARRMEVFTAIYDKDLNLLHTPSAIILDSESFKDILSSKQVFFFGNGSEKWQRICVDKNAHFINVEISADAFANLSYQKFLKKDFATLAYAEPVYLKEFYTHHK